MGHAQVGRQRRFVNGKAVVLSGNHHYIVIDIFNRVVTAVVAEFHLNGLRAARQRQQLMAETDAKDRNIGGEEFFNRRDGVIARRRVARAVRQENTVRIQLKHVFCRRLRRNDSQAAAAVNQHPQDIALGAEVISHDVERQLAFRLRFRQVARQCPAPLGPGVSLCGCDLFRQVHAVQTRECLGFFQRQLGIKIIAGDDAAILRPFLTQ